MLPFGDWTELGPLKGERKDQNCATNWRYYLARNVNRSWEAGGARFSPIASSAADAETWPSGEYIPRAPPT
jgi:hypothetical protein